MGTLYDLSQAFVQCDRIERSFGVDWWERAHTDPETKPVGYFVLRELSETPLPVHYSDMINVVKHPMLPTTILFFLRSECPIEEHVEWHPLETRLSRYDYYTPEAARRLLQDNLAWPVQGAIL